MKTGEANFHFPVLGFTSDLHIWGFQDLDRLTRCGPRTLKEDTQIGMEFVDAGGRRWKVRSVRRTGRAGSFLSLLLPFGPPQSRIEHDLEPMETVSIEELRRRVCTALEAHAETYFEGGERETEFEPLLSAVLAACSVSEVYELLQPDTFEPH
jgi:hypothetical protein